MPASSLNNPVADLKAAKAALAAVRMPWRGRLWMLLVNYVPLAHLLAIIATLLLPVWTWPTRIGLALVGLYLLPPLLARLILLVAPIAQGRIAIGSRSFFVWWLVFQLQIIFCRLPFLEETLRLIPGVYSLWLRLWGAHIGRLVYWSPGTAITDRSFLRIGNDVVFGAGVRLNAHVLAKNKQGGMELLLATVKIGDRAVIGGYALLTCGTEVAADETTRACQLSPPFSIWQDGKRIKSQSFDGLE
jgi:hypothetical protein